MLEIRRAVITGPTGAIGTALCEALLRGGAAVYAVVRPDSPRADALPAGVVKVACDLSGLSMLPEKIEGGADAFFHLGWAHTSGAGRNDMQAQTRNIQYALDAVNAAAALECRVFVGAGSQAEYGRVEGKLRADTPCFPENGYGIAKRCAGEMTRIECQRLGIRHVWARILSVYGPRDGANTVVSYLIRTLLEGKKPSLTAGGQMWDYLYSGDAAQALVRMAQSGRDGSVYPLGGGQARPLKEYFSILRDQIDPALELGLGDIPYQPLTVMHLVADIDQLTKDTGFIPTTSFEEGIARTIAFMKE